MSMQTDRVGSARLSATEVKIAHAMAELDLAKVCRAQQLAR